MKLRYFLVMISTGCERRLLGALAAVCLAPWLIACVTDVNHPPGTRTVRISAAVVVIGLGLLEYYRAWWGFYVFLALWPHALVVQELLIKCVSPLFEAFPKWWAGPAAAILAMSYLFRSWARGRRDACGTSVVILDSESESSNRRWSNAVRIGLWLLVLAWLVAMTCALFRTAHPGPDWKVECTDLRHLLLPGPFSSLYPLLWTLEFLPSLILGLALLNPSGRSNPDGRATRPQIELLSPVLPMQRSAGVSPATLARLDQILPVNTCVWIACASGAVAAMYLLLQYLFDWHWSFDMTPPSGPFPNRNTTAPFLLITATLTMTLMAKASWTARIGVGIAGLFQTLMALMLGSRNAWLMLVMLLAIPLLRLKKWAMVGVCASLIAICVSVILWAPLNKLASFTPQRILTTIEGARINNLKQATGDRQGIYQAAYEIFKTYPLTGSGPGTIHMLAHRDSRFGAYIKDGDNYYPFFSHAHSIPIHLLAECGLLGMASWVLLWLILPVLAISRWKAGWSFATAVLIAGLGNLCDACWFTPGMTTFCVLLLVLAFRNNEMSLTAHKTKTGAR
ncbi:MAG: O-antigen ligase family protein [Planctomycetota bacterium]